MTERPITLLLVDDHDIVRRGLADLYEAHADSAVVGQAGSISDALTVARKVRPDVVVLHVRLPDGNGMALCRDLRSMIPEMHCFELTWFADDRALVESAAAGASAYLLKEINGTDIVAAVRAVAGGSLLLDRAEVRMAEARLSRSELHIPDILTRQERRIFELIVDGCSNRQIAEELYLAEKTLKNYVSNLLAKLAMSRRTEVAALAGRIREQERRRFE